MKPPELNEVIDTSMLPDFRQSFTEGVHQLVRKEEADQLSHFLKAFENYREKGGDLRVSKEQFSQLPFIKGVQEELWKLRQYDLELIRRLTEGEGKMVLDLGAWNGWLSNRLSEAGQKVVAIDIFMHEEDGLKAKKYYPNDWLSIQMDMNDLSVLKSCFDLIIVNRCFPYFTDKWEACEQMKRILRPGGRIIFTGLCFYRKSKEVARQLEKSQEDFYRQYRLPLLYKPSRGFLSEEDKSSLKRAGFSLKKYPQLWLGNLKAVFFHSSPQYYYGVYETSAASKNS